MKTSSSIFDAWVKHEGDWLETCYEVGFKVRTTDSTKSQHSLWSRADIERKYKSLGSL